MGRSWWAFVFCSWGREHLCCRAEGFEKEETPHSAKSGQKLYSFSFMVECLSLIFCPFFVCLAHSGRMALLLLFHPKTIKVVVYWYGVCLVWVVQSIKKLLSGRSLENNSYFLCFTKERGEISSLHTGEAKVYINVCQGNPLNQYFLTYKSCKQSLLPKSESSVQI